MKSTGVAVGIVAAFVTTFLLGSQVGAARTDGAGATAPNATQGGRYQMIFNPSGLRADTFLVDTATGRIWRPSKFDDVVGEPTAWIWEDRIDTPSQLSTWIGTLPKKSRP